MKAISVILAVDRNHRNLELLSQFLGREGYQTRPAATLEEFDQALAEANGIGLALVDIAGFDRAIWERCEGLRHHEIPFLVLSPKQSAAIQQASLTHGARGVLIKPLVVRELLGAHPQPAGGGRRPRRSGRMSRILLLLDHRQNRRLLAEWLEQNHQVVMPETDRALQEAFDLAILDGLALDRLWEQVRARKQTEEPLFLPVLLLTSRQGVDLVTRHLWRTIDEVVLRPIEKVELQARAEVLLRARGLSVALQQRHADMEAFLRAMTHELRAPLRVITGFAEELQVLAPRAMRRSIVCVALALLPSRRKN